jgi:hypothetical protein
MNLLAYLDPGSGSIVLQVIIGGILGIGVVLKAYWSKIVRLFGKNRTSTEKTANSTKSSE